MQKYLPLLLIICFSLLAWFLGLKDYFNLETLRLYHGGLSLYIKEHLTLSLLIYSLAYILIVTLSIPVAAFMTILGGFLFGQFLGTCVVVISATLGAVLIFISAKRASKDLLTQKAGKFAQKMHRGFNENAFSYLLTLRLIPLFPFVAVNLAAALFQIPLRTFFTATFMGIIPGSFVYVALGVALQTVIDKPDLSLKLALDPKILLALGGLGLLSLLPIVYKKFKGRKK